MPIVSKRKNKDILLDGFQNFGDTRSRDTQAPTFGQIFQLRAFDKYLRDCVVDFCVSPARLVWRHIKHTSRQSTGNDDEEPGRRE